MRLGLTPILFAAIVDLAFVACGGGGDDEPDATLRPDPNKTFGNPAAAVTLTEYFDYR